MSVQDDFAAVREGIDPGHPTVFFDAVDRIEEQNEDLHKSYTEALAEVTQAWTAYTELKEQLEAAEGERDRAKFAALETADALVASQEQLEAVTNSWKMAERALVRMEEQLETAQRDARDFYNASCVYEDQIKELKEQLEASRAANDRALLLIRRLVMHHGYPESAKAEISETHEALLGVLRHDPA